MPDEKQRDELRELSSILKRFLLHRGKILTDEAIRELGYRKVTVTIEEPGKPPKVTHTWRKPDNRLELYQEIRDVLTWPDDLLKAIEDTEPEQWGLDELTAYDIVRRQKLGGRGATGTTKHMAELYRRRVRAYVAAKQAGSCWGIRDFCEEWGMSERTLYRAFEFVEDHGPDDIRAQLAEIRS